MSPESEKRIKGTIEDVSFKLPPTSVNHSNLGGKLIQQQVIGGQDLNQTHDVIAMARGGQSKYTHAEPRKMIPKRFSS